MKSETPFVPGESEPEPVTPAEMTVRVDVEVGFTILDLSGEHELDETE